MRALRVAILCINPWDDPGTYQPFSYAAYRLQAALHQWPGVDECRVFEGFGWSVERFVDEVEAFGPDVVGASAYLWSLPTFVQVLARIKRAHPEVVTIVGGPSARPEMMQLEPYRAFTSGIDALAFGEGEEVMREVVGRASLGLEGLLGIAGLAVRDRGFWRRTAARTPIENLDQIPSPYQLGLAPTGVSAHLETFRGCPLSCQFCEWGVGGNRGSFNSEEYLVRELEAIGSMNALGVYGVDAGLNLHAKAFRHLAAAEEQTGVIKRLGLACEVYPSFVRDDHLEFLQATRARIGIGLQTYNTEVLRRIERPFDPNKFERTVDRLSAVVHTTAGIIVGLPGDTPASFRETLRRALDLPCRVRVFMCLVLPDAFLTRAAPDAALDFDPVTMQMRSCLGWSERDLRETMEFLCEETERHDGTYALQPYGAGDQQTQRFGDGYSGSVSTYWYFPKPGDGAGPGGDADTERSAMAPDWVVALRERLAPTAPPGWRLSTLGSEHGVVRVAFETPDGPLTVLVEAVDESRRVYRVSRGLAFSYAMPARGELEQGALGTLDRVIESLSSDSELRGLIRES